MRYMQPCDTAHETLRHLREDFIPSTLTGSSIA